jgi:asparagine synthase (glutamine-hydrolysing)
MCGIAGIFRQRRTSAAPFPMASTVRAMVQTMVHRGPDAEGVWEDPDGGCVLGHRRLSIIDTSDAGRQPMSSLDGRWVITFNGEIYNYLELRSQLEAMGARFVGRTDTEVLIQAIAFWGISALSRLDGMYAFAAFDTLSGELLLARDPFGEKPLYYTQLDDSIVAFASELQALERVPGFDFSVDVDAMAEVLSFQYIGAPRSIYASVRKLKPGHWLRIDAVGRRQTSRYFSFRPGLSGFTDRSIPDLVDELEDILVRSIRRRMIADVPVGAFLSGGVDSSVVCALVRRKLDRPLMTFSIGFEGSPESEHLIAREFGERLQTIHRDEVLAPDSAEFLHDIGGLLDEPNGDSSCLPTYLLSRFARQHVTVAVSGDGGDELFGGYGRYFATLDERAASRAGTLLDWKPGPVYFGNRILVASEPHIGELFGFIPGNFAGHLSRLRSQLDCADDNLLGEMRRVDTDNYMPGAVLPKVDRMSMRHSLEVRTPYLSVELARFAERLPEHMLVNGGRGKLLLRELAYRYLPRDLVDLPKKGFGLPVSNWGRDSLLKAAGLLLESDDSRLRASFGSENISRFLTRQRTPDTFSAYQVWAVAMLESWLRHRNAEVPRLAECRPRATFRPSGKDRVPLAADRDETGLDQLGSPGLQPELTIALVDPREMADELVIVSPVGVCAPHSAKGAVTSELLRSKKESPVETHAARSADGPTNKALEILDQPTMRALLEFQDEKIRSLQSDLDASRAKVFKCDADLADMRRYLTELSAINESLARARLEAPMAPRSPRLHRLLRRTARLVWWTVTLQLPSRMREYLAYRRSRAT